MSIKDDIVIYGCENETEAIARRFFEFMVERCLFAGNKTLYDRVLMIRARIGRLDTFDVLWRDRNMALRCELYGSEFIQPQFQRYIGKKIIGFGGNTLESFAEDNREALKAAFDRCEEDECWDYVLNAYVFMFLLRASKDFAMLGKMRTGKMVLQLTRLW